MNNSNLQIVRQYITQIMPQIEHPPCGNIPYPWLSVSHGLFYGSAIYVWDHHHAAMRFAISGKPDYLRFLVENLLTYQQDDGNTPSVLHVDRGPRFIDPPYHAQPFLFQSAFLYVHQTGDKAWGESVFAKLTKYLNYYDNNYSAAFGLKRWRVGWMGGLDNDVVTAFLPPDTIASSDINAWLYIEMLAAEKLAKLLERSEEADSFARRSKKHREIVNDKLWYGRMNSYSAFSLCDGSPLFSLSCEGTPKEIGQFAFQSCSNLIPLYARMADHDLAQAMIKTYVINENHFWSPYGIRSLSKASEYFNNAVWGNPSRFGDHRRMTESNWQGPVWIPINYFVFHALRHYGFMQEAGVLAGRTLAVLAKSLQIQKSFSENFNSETGEPLYASCYASWNLLGDTLHDDLTDGSWIMEPIFSET
ncbi:MAG: MGH1-like glycoside hydrolase domain-containing protein [Sedimentisphaerales bacterium]